MQKTSIDDVLVCPKCSSTDCYDWETDECEFEDNEGHITKYCRCKTCGTNFSLRAKFEYNVTSASVQAFAE